VHPGRHLVGHAGEQRAHGGIADEAVHHELAVATILCRPQQPVGKRAPDALALPGIGDDKTDFSSAVIGRRHVAERDDLSTDVIRLGDHRNPPLVLGAADRAQQRVRKDRQRQEESQVPRRQAQTREQIANDAQQRNVAVDRAVADVYAALASVEALALNREGDFDLAIARLEATARRIEQYAGSDPELRAIVASLLGRHRVYSQPMSAMVRQSEHYSSRNRVSMRDASGKARQRANS